MVEIAHQNKMFSKEELRSVWGAATGDIHKYVEGKDKYFKQDLYLGDGEKVGIELHPDMLNGRGTLRIEDFDYFEEDDRYLDGIQAVAHVAQQLKDAGVNLTIEGPQGYEGDTDTDRIKSDVEALLVTDEDGGERVAA